MLAFGLLCAGTALAAGGSSDSTSPEQIAAQRQEILDAMLTDRFQPYGIANLRRSCAQGDEPASVAESRAQGGYYTPDAADRCTTALVRTARDGHLPDLYRELLTALGGDASASDRWPRAIGAAVLGGAANVAIGNHKAAEVSPSLAFDAGFTVAWADGSAAKAANVDAVKLKAAAEACLGKHQDVGTCFSVGYASGARAFAKQTAAR